MVCVIVMMASRLRWGNADIDTSLAGMISVRF
jgi:hypothetical protein